MKRKRTDQLIGPVELAGGASYSYTTVLSKFLYPPPVSVCLSTYSGFISLSLYLLSLYLFPGGDIYQMSGQRFSLSTGLDLLRA